jgi:NDP-sugar pyrophosphorylase family protein
MEMPRCFVLLGGRGTRLFPLTSFIHKSMIPVAGRPVIEHIVNHLKTQGITDIVFCVSNSLSKEQIIHYFGDGSRFGMTIRFSVGPWKLDTAGRILCASSQNLINGAFVVYYGDVLTDLNMREVYKFHQEKGGIGTIVFSPNLPIASGIGWLDESGLVQKIREKPLLPYTTNLGIYILEPEILKFIEPNADFFNNTFPLAIRNKEKLYGYVSNCHWMDVGTFRNLQMAGRFVKENLRHS